MLEKRDAKGRTEAEAIAAYKEKNYPKPALTADIVLFTRDGNQVKVLLIRRGNHPYLGCWALPGGFANPNEPVAHTAFRELQEETGVMCDALQLVGVYSKPGRDPRGWVVSAAYTACVESGDHSIRGADDAAEARWMTVQLVDGQPMVLLPDGEQLAFDHAAILRDALHVNALMASAKDILDWVQGKNAGNDTE